MPQVSLPIFPEGISLINGNVGFRREGSTMSYFLGPLPVFRHDVSDIRSFRMITSQLYVNGNASQSEICRAFGVSRISVKRYVKLYREKGVAGFYQEPRRRGAGVLTPSVLTEVQGLLDEGLAVTEIGERMGLRADILRKAVRAGRLHQPVKKSEESELVRWGSTKSERSAEDALAPIKNRDHKKP